MSLFPALINIGGEDFPLLGKVIIRRDQSSTSVFISSIRTGNIYAESQYGCVALVDRNLRVSRGSGSAGYAIIHPDGTHQDNLTGASTVSKNDIVLWGNDCTIQFSDPS